MADTADREYSLDLKEPSSFSDCGIYKIHLEGLFLETENSITILRALLYSRGNSYEL